MHMLENEERPGPVPGDVTPAPSSDAQPKPDAKTVEQKPEASTTSADTDTPGTDAAAEQKKPKGSGVQERIDELTRDKNEWRRKAEELERQVTASKAAPAAEDAEPTPENFKTWDAYEKAQREWLFKEATRRAKSAILEEQSKEANAKAKAEAEEHFKDARKRFDARAAEIAPQYEGLDKAIENLWNGKVPCSDAMAEFLFEGTDKGPEVVFHLNANPDEARAIAKLPPIAAAAAMARLESKLAETKAKPSEAPPPPKEVKGGRSSDAYDPNKASTEENIERWRAAKARKTA